MDAPLLDCDDQHDCGEESKTNMAVAPAKKVELQSFIGLGNNPRLVRDALSQYGYKEMAKGMQFSDKYRYKWT